GRQPLGILIDHDDLAAGTGDVLGVGPADPAPSTDDDVVRHRLDVAFHAPPPNRVADVPLDQRLDQDAEGISGGADAGEDENRAEDGVDAALVADGGDRLR